jgi:cell wall-associated NlpC family hydrolase
MVAPRSSWSAVFVSLGALVLALGLAAGCSSSEKTKKAPKPEPESSPSQPDRTDREAGGSDETTRPREARPEPVKVLRVPRVRRRLETAAEDWMGVPYEWSGESKQGIDCSALVQTLYQEAFNWRLPRVTELQVQAGSTVTRQQLRPGDLVFFHPGGEGNHVGVYAGDREFIHASTSEGVTRTRFDDYWQRHYWTSRRVLGPSKVPDTLASQLVAYRYPDSTVRAPGRPVLADRDERGQDVDPLPPADDEGSPTPDTTIISTDMEEPPAPDETDDQVRIAARSDTTALPSCADPDVQCGTREGEGAFGDTTFASPDTTNRMGW